MREISRSTKTVKNIATIAKFVLFGLVVLWIIFLLVEGNISLAAVAADIPNNPLADWVANISSSVGALVGLLAVVMVIIAGVVYIFDLGGGKQIGLAKDMIISAISGVVLFILASWLLGQVNSLFPPLLDPGGGGKVNNSPIGEENPENNPGPGGLPSPPGGHGGGGSGGFIPPMDYGPGGLPII